MKIKKVDLVNACQDFINSYWGKWGTVNMSIYESFTKFKFGIDEGYYGTIKNQIHWVIQGTDEDREWCSNLKFIKERVNFPSKDHFGRDKKIKVHSGLFDAYKQGRKMFLEGSKGYKYIFIKAHSRGAGIGTIFARDLQYHIDKVWKTKQTVILITGGSPRVYNWYGAKEFNKTKIKSYRLKYRNDIVCNVPWPIFGYKHVKSIVLLGHPYIPSPIGIPWDHLPSKYLKGMREYRGKI